MCDHCILVVEDDPDVREALTACIESLGCCTAAAVDGIDAMERLKQCPRPCFVLLDLNMPRLDGDSFAQLVRRDAQLSTIPLVSMSAGSDRLRPPVVHSHLEKPFSCRALAEIIERFCPEPRGRGDVNPARVP